MDKPTNTQIKFPLAVTTIDRNEYDCLQFNVREGHLPKDLYGHVFIAVPAGTFNWDEQPGCFHLNGDGMIYRLDFNPSSRSATFKTKLVKPPDYYDDLNSSQKCVKWQKINRFKNHGLMRFSLFYGFRDQLNTAFLPLKFKADNRKRLLVTYDAGCPYEINPNTLEILSPVGNPHNPNDWRPEFRVGKDEFKYPPILSTAHPVFDTYTKEMFTVNYGRSAKSFMELINELPLDIQQKLDEILERIAGLEDFVYLIRWDGGQLQRWKLVNAADNSPVAIQQSIHQIGLTEDYIILMDTAMTVGIEQVLNNADPENKELEAALRELLETLPSPDTAVYIVPRSYLKSDRTQNTAPAYKVTIPREAVHFLTDYQTNYAATNEKKITLHVAHISAWDISEWTRSFDVYPDSKKDPSVPDAYQGGDLPSQLQGILPSEMDLGVMGRYVIDAKTLGDEPPKIDCELVSDENQTWGTGFFAYRELLASGDIPQHLNNIYCTSFGLWQDVVTKYMHDRYKDYKYRKIPLADVLNWAVEGKPSCLYRLNVSPNASLAIEDCYTADPGYMLLSCQFAPRPDNAANSAKDYSTDGYIVCSVFTPNQAGNQPGNSEIWIFDAGNLKAGPVCKLQHDRFKMGLSLHSTWLPDLGSY